MVKKELSKQKILLLLIIRQAGHMSIHDLADRVKRPYSSIYYLVCWLARQGLVRKPFSRSNSLHLTEAGHEAVRDYYLVEAEKLDVYTLAHVY